MKEHYAMKYEGFVLEQLGGVFKGTDTFGVGRQEYWGVDDVDTQNLTQEAKFGLEASGRVLSNLSQGDMELCGRIDDIVKRIPTATYADAHSILDELIKIKEKITS